MKKTITQKLSYLALGLLFFSPLLKAEDVKVDYTDFLKNPSFENYLDGTPIDVTSTTDVNLISGALRGTPPGWSDTGVTPPATGNISYGINRNAVNKDGYNSCFLAANPFPDPYALYQEVQNLPAGQYVVSCRMWVSSARLTNQRLFVQTKNGANISNNIVQYFGKETDYLLNLTAGETNTFAGWDFTTAVSDAESRLKPMSIVVTVADGETLVLGVKSGDMIADGTHTETQQGFIKVDDFRVKRVVAADPNDHTSSIVNPSFEQILVDGVPTQLKTHNIAAYSATDPQRGLPYGWLSICPDSIGQSYGVNTDANGIDGAKIMWIMRTPKFLSSYQIYQDISGLPEGKYQVSCSMFVENNKITTQRLFANNHVQYYGTEYDYFLNLTDGEVNTYAGWAALPNAFSNGLFLKEMSVEVDVHNGESLRIGAKTSDIKTDGTVATATEGWFKVDNFRLKRVGNITGLNKVETAYFTVNGQKGGFWLNMEKTTLAHVKVLSLSGQAIYNSNVNTSASWISLPQGLYIVNVTANGVNKAVKVLVK